MLRKPIYYAFIRRGYEKFGNTYAVFLYNVGFKMGLEGYKSHLSTWGEIRFTGELCQSSLKHMGFGIIEIETMSKSISKLICRVYHSCECEFFKEEKKPSNHFIRGILAGWITGFFNQEMIARETKCIAKKDLTVDLRYQGGEHYLNHSQRILH